MKKTYTEIETLNPYGRSVTIYTTIDRRMTVSLENELNGDYWWVKINHMYGTGSDGSFNLTDKTATSLGDILTHIAKKNIKVKAKQV